MECHSKWNVTQNGMSLKFECHRNWNFSPILIYEYHSNFNTKQIEKVDNPKTSKSASIGRISILFSLFKEDFLSDDDNDDNGNDDNDDYADTDDENDNDDDDDDDDDNDIKNYDNNKNFCKNNDTKNQNKDNQNKGKHN